LPTLFMHLTHARARRDCRQLIPRCRKYFSKRAVWIVYNTNYF